MKRSAFLVVLLLVVLPSLAQQPTRLIVRGDDMGYSHSGNLALIRSYLEGIETSIEVIVPSPWFPEAVVLLKQHPGVDVGIHLALTSEWDKVKWRPLSDCPSLKDPDGYFFSMVYPNKDYPGQAIMENKWTLAEVEKEFRAQIELALKHIPRISHLSAHMSCTNMTEEVKALTTRLAKEYKIPVESDWDALPQLLPFGGPAKTSKEKVKRFVEALDRVEPGKTYLFVEHPGLNNEELQAISHIGYEDVAADRQGVTDLFTNRKVKAFIRKKGIQLIGYKDLVRK